MYKIIPFLFSVIALSFSCQQTKVKFDASGSFEAEEVIVSSEISGKLVSFNLEEGSVLTKDSVVGILDATNLALQKEQVEASIQSLNDKTMDVGPQVKLLEDQVAVQQSQMNTLLHEKQRVENLIKADAATGKQLDDINAQIDLVKNQVQVTLQQINVQRNTVATQNRSILSERKPLSKRMAQLEDQEKRAAIINPLSGTVISKYAQAGEITGAGKALYKISNLDFLILRAYMSGDQLYQVKLGQSVKVWVDNGKDKYKELTGIVTWISDKAEFTPKTIQTKDERANLVYAMKIKVRNDGYLKIGMYGEVNFL